MVKYTQNIWDIHYCQDILKQAIKYIYFNETIVSEMKTNEKLMCYVCVRCMYVRYDVFAQVVRKTKKIIPAS